MAYGFKSGGRTSGTPNKRTTLAGERLREIEAKLRDEGRLEPSERLDPLEAMALAMIDHDSESSVRLAAAKELAQYLYPKRRAVEVAETAPQIAPMATNDAMAQIHAAIDRAIAAKGEGASDL